MRTRCRPCFHDPLGRPLRLTGRPDSEVVVPDGLLERLTDPQIAGKHPSVIDRHSCRATRWGNPQRYVPGVRFTTREPAAVIQTVVHCMLQNRLAGFRIRRVAGKHIGKAASRVRHCSYRYPQNA